MNKIDSFVLDDYYFPESAISWRAFVCWYKKNENKKSQITKEFKEEILNLKSLDKKIEEWYSSGKIRRKRASGVLYIVSKEILNDFIYELTKTPLPTPIIVEETNREALINIRKCSLGHIQAQNFRKDFRDYFNNLFEEKDLPLEIERIILMGRREYIKTAYPQKVPYNNYMAVNNLLYIMGANIRDALTHPDSYPTVLFKGKLNKKSILGLIYTINFRTRIEYTN